MNRKRRFDAAADDTDTDAFPVCSISDFTEALPHLDEPYHLANTLEIYCVYAAFTREGYQIEVQSCHTRFYTLSMTKDSVVKTVVPISCNYQGATMSLLSEIASLSGNLFVAWVAHDGAFTIYRVGEGIMAPEEKLKAEGH